MEQVAAPAQRAWRAAVCDESLFQVYWSRSNRARLPIRNTARQMYGYTREREVVQACSWVRHSRCCVLSESERQAARVTACGRPRWTVTVPWSGARPGPGDRAAVEYAGGSAQASCRDPPRKRAPHRPPGRLRTSQLQQAAQHAGVRACAAAAARRRWRCRMCAHLAQQRRAPRARGCVEANSSTAGRWSGSSPSGFR